MPLKKYSKPSSFYTSTKQSFFSQNSELLETALEKNSFYSTQPLREECKLCKTPLPSSVDFQSHGVGYIFCEQCGHLNGKFEDTQQFVEELYINDGGTDYSVNYIDSDYKSRTDLIYIPKVDFLTQNLPSEPYSILDVGCGAGYFVAAAALRNIDATGIDVSQNMITHGNKQIEYLTGNKSLLQVISEDDFYEKVIKTEATVVSAIGVIEHLRDPQSFLKAFSQSKAEYLYYSVPMFSVSAILENAFLGIFPRQLSGGHTHLFTEDSIKNMHRQFKYESIAEWRFGTDAMDLYRSLMVTLENNQSSKKMLNMSEKALHPIIDELQTVIDQSEFCSEIHCLVKKV